MLEIDFDRLRPIGLTPAIAQALCREHPDRGRAVRIVQVQRETVLVHDGSDEIPVRVAPPLHRAAAAGGEPLAVGDWAIVRDDAHGAPWLVFRLAPLTRLARRGSDGSRQAIVHNVDTAFLLMGLDENFNPRRIERYLALVQPERVWPVIVLTKVDCVDEAPTRIATLRARIPETIDVVAIDATSPAAASALAPYLGAGSTIVLLGSSGAGKSTLTNTLAGRELQRTGATREKDARGRHTTSTRTLRLLDQGACVIDTPGLRGLRPDIEVGALAASFSDIDELARSCRFRDCTHGTEPGCAVRAVIAADRIANFHKLQREIRRDTMDALARQQLQAQMKVRARAMRVRMREKH